jgi:hypothetical protein
MKNSDFESHAILICQIFIVSVLVGLFVGVALLALSK